MIVSEFAARDQFCQFKWDKSANNVRKNLHYPTKSPSNLEFAANTFQNSTQLLPLVTFYIL
jgi:hypothetical protein